MSGTVAAIARIIPDSCHATHCDKDKCRVDLAEAPPVRVFAQMVDDPSAKPKFFTTTGPQ